MQKDLNASISLRQSTESKVQCAYNRAEKAEMELAALHEANVDMNLRIIRLQAENGQLREDNQCAPNPHACWSVLLLIQPFTAPTQFSPHMQGNAGRALQCTA
jgi:FtsZ-binding cell division protein ZapB